MQKRAKFFARDQVGMSLQLEMFAAALRLLDEEFADFLVQADAINCFFAYRWFLCLFKREIVVMDDVMRLWECLWSNYHRCGAGGEGSHLKPVP